MECYQFDGAPRYPHEPGRPSRPTSTASAPSASCSRTWPRRCSARRARGHRPARRAGRGRPRRRRMSAAATEALPTCCGEIQGLPHLPRHARGQPLPHEPRPVLRPSATARLCICSQAPGARVHASGTPFTDPSGDRLRAWLGLSRRTSSTTSAASPSCPWGSASRAMMRPAATCRRARNARAPGTRACSPLMPQLELVLLVGSYAQRWHLGEAGGAA